MVFAERDRYKHYTDEWHNLRKIKGMVSRSTAVAVIVVGSLGTLSTRSTMKETRMPDFNQQNVAAMLRVDSNEVSRLSEALMDASPYSYAVNNMYMNRKFVKDVLKESEWASEQLNIPKQFILSQWFMEDGMLQPSGFNYVRKNNLAGIQNSNREPARFDNLHEFAKDYVAILQKDGVNNTNDFIDIVNGLCDGNYAGGEGPISYGSKVLTTMGQLRFVGNEYDQYYQKSYKEFNSYAELDR